MIIDMLEIIKVFRCLPNVTYKVFQKTESLYKKGRLYRVGKIQALFLMMFELYGGLNQITFLYVV